MSGTSKIEWTDATWNPIVGCSIVSPGCTNCYAMKLAGRRLKNTPKYKGLTKDSKAGPVWTGDVRLWEKALLDPLHWKKGRKIFVNSEGDLFHESIPDEWIDRVFAVMALCPQHTFQVLTKRADRMRAYLTRLWAGDNANEETPRWYAQFSCWMALPDFDKSKLGCMPPIWPLPNVWLGVSTERQQEADERIPLLLKTPAAVRFISAEPLIGPINLNHVNVGGEIPLLRSCVSGDGRRLNWVIVGGESGSKARPFNIEWADDLVAQCSAADVPCFVKQLGSMPMSDGYPLELSDRKGGDETEWPARLNVRQFPQAHKSMITSGEHQRPESEIVRQ